MKLLKKPLSRKEIPIFLLYLVVVIVFIGILPCMSSLHTLRHIYSVLQVATAAVLLIKIFKKRQFNKFWVAISCLFLIFIISSLINFDRDTVLHSISESARVIGACALVYNAANSNGHKKILLYSTLTVLSTLIIANTISLFVYPEGMYATGIGFTQNWILGYKNTHIRYYLLYMLCLFLFSQGKRRANSLPIYYYISCIIFLFLSIIVQSTSSIVVMSVMFVLLLFFKPISKRNFSMKLMHFAIVYFCAFFGIIVFKIQTLFSPLLEAILHRDASFTGRSTIWDTAIKQVSQYPIIGHGYSSPTYTDILNSTAYSTHNFILDILYKAGIIGLASFMIFAIFSLQPLFKSSKTAARYSLIVLLISVSILSLVESIGIALPCLLFTCCYNINAFTTEGQK